MRKGSLGFKNGCEPILQTFFILAIGHPYFAFSLYFSKYDWSPFISSLFIQPQYSYTHRLILVIMFGIPQLWFFIIGWASVLAAATTILIYVYLQIFLTSEIK